MSLLGRVPLTPLPQVWGGWPSRGSVLDSEKGSVIWGESRHSEVKVVVMRAAAAVAAGEAAVAVLGGVQGPAALLPHAQPRMHSQMGASRELVRATARACTRTLGLAGPHAPVQPRMHSQTGASREAAHATARACNRAGACVPAAALRQPPQIHLQQQRLLGADLLVLECQLAQHAQHPQHSGRQQVQARVWAGGPGGGGLRRRARALCGRCTGPAGPWGWGRTMQ